MHSIQSSALSFESEKAKGHLISKWFFRVVDFLQKMNENKSHSSKNELIRSFLQEIDEPWNHFEINWPLDQTKKRRTPIKENFQKLNISIMKYVL